MQDFGDLLGDGPVMLEDLIRVSDRPLPDREPFLRAWIAFLREQEGASADRWLREAIRLLEGTKCNEIRCERNPVSVHHLPRTKSGVGSSFLPEKVNRHRAKKLGRGG